MKIKLYQLPIEKDYVFRSYDFVKEFGLFNLKDYKQVYEFELPIEKAHINKLLDYIFEKFNINRPQDYKSRSLSVSDLIEIENEGLYYVDSFGFQKVIA